jgi:hypothetical protein
MFANDISDVEVEVCMRGVSSAYVTDDVMTVHFWRSCALCWGFRGWGFPTSDLHSVTSERRRSCKSP